MNRLKRTLSGLRQRSTRLIGASWVLFHLLLPLGLVGAYAIGRPRFVGLFLYVVMATALVDVYLWSTRTDVSDDSLSPLVTNPRLPLLAYLLSLLTFVWLGGGFTYYAVLAGTGALVLLAVLFEDEQTVTRRRWFYLGLLLALSGTAVLTQVLSTAYHANSSDVIWHTSFIELVAEYGRFEVISSPRYVQIPGYHIVGAIVHQLTGLTARTAAAFLVVGVYEMMLLVIYALTKRYWVSDRIALTATALAALNASVLHRAAKSHSQELSLGFFCLIFLLFVRKSDDDRYLILATLLGGAWIMTHHLSVAMGLSVLGALMMERLYQVIRSAEWKLAQTHFFLYTALIAAVITYWVLITRLIVDVVNWIFGYSPAARGETSNLLIETYSELPVLVDEAVPYLLRYVYFTPLLCLALIGGYTLFSTQRFRADQYMPGLLVFGFAAIMYFPNPLWIPIEGIATPFRWSTIVYFILAPLTGAGMYAIYVDTHLSRYSSLLFISIFLVLFASISGGLANPTLADVAGPDKETRTYISESELQGVEFIHANSRPEQSIWAPSRLDIYLMNYPPDPIPSRDRSIRKVQMDLAKNEIISGRGLTVVSTDAYENDAVMVRAITYKCGIGENEAGFTVATAETSVWKYHNRNIIYSNGKTLITYSDRTRAARLKEGCPETP